MTSKKNKRIWGRCKSGHKNGHKFVAVFVAVFVAGYPLFSRGLSKPGRNDNFVKLHGRVKVYIFVTI